MSALAIEELNPAQFGELRNVYEGFVPPPNAVAIVAKSAGEIVGRVFLMEPVHLEGPWVREDYRGSTVGKRLLDAAALRAKRSGITKLFAYAASDQLADYLNRLGFTKEPYTVFGKEI